MAESAEEKKDRLPGSNFLSKLLIRKIKKSKANKESKKFKKNEKKNKKQVAKEAKKAVIRTMPGTTKLEKRLNFAGAKARVRDAERREKRSNKKADREVKRDLRKSNRAVKKATIESMPGNTMLEKRLNFAGAKARARKADREENKRLKKEGPLQQTSRKIEMPSQEVKSPLLKRKDLKVSETPLSPEQRSEKEKSKGRSETGKAFDSAFAKARREKGPGKTFMFEGKEYTTNLKEEGNKTTPSSYSTSDAVRKGKADNSNKQDQAKHGGALAIMIAPVKSKKMKAVKKGAHGAKVKKAPGGAAMKEMKMMKKGGKLKMVKGPDGKMVPFYAADGKGKMMYGGSMKKAMYGAKMKKKAMYGAKMKKKY